MKLFYIFILSISIVFTGCRDDEQFESSMEATIYGSEWCTVTRIAELTDDNKLIITGTSEDEKTIIITISGTDEETYSLFADSTKMEFSAVYKTSLDENPEEIYVATSGEVIITRHKKREQRITGSFHFNASSPAGSLSITNGVFENLKYTTGE